VCGWSQKALGVFSIDGIIQLVKRVCCSYKSIISHVDLSESIGVAIGEVKLLSEVALS
jgi:hypothetical protein